MWSKTPKRSVIRSPQSWCTARSPTCPSPARTREPSGRPGLTPVEILYRPLLRALDDSSGPWLGCRSPGRVRRFEQAHDVRGVAHRCHGRDRGVADLTASPGADRRGACDRPSFRPASTIGPTEGSLTFGGPGRGTHESTTS